MSPPINGMPENFIQSFQYDGQSPQNQMHPQIFMPIPAPPTPSTPRQNGSPSTVTSSNSGANSPTVDHIPLYIHATPVQKNLILKFRGLSEQPIRGSNW
ncbi:8067_t:CDS:2 [Entrophospora sp. SA101]|nr:8067_t:CDS:2 [Entrophospora sp. SA101]